MSRAVGAVQRWADGRFSKAGCTLAFLLDWAWARVTHIKETVDRWVTHK